MIGRIRGEVAELGGGAAIIDVGGVGYELNVGPALVAELTVGEERIFRVSTQVREDSITLYGFLTQGEREAFEILIGLPKVGPKLGLAILDSLGLEKLAAAVSRNDAKALTQVPGIGRKTAQRLLVDLEGKLPAHFVPTDGKRPAPVTSAPTDPLPLALARLGYRKSEIDKALHGLVEAGLDERDLQTRLSASLRILSGGKP